MSVMINLNPKLELNLRELDMHAGAPELSIILCNIFIHTYIIVICESVYNCTCTYMGLQNTAWAYMRKYLACKLDKLLWSIIITANYCISYMYSNIILQCHTHTLISEYNNDVNIQHAW